MTLEQLKVLHSVLDYSYRCLFSPSTVIVVMMFLGFLPSTLWTLLIVILLPVVDGIVKGFVKAVEEIIIEVES